jgi:heterodisulfide reductase subunit C
MLDAVLGLADRLICADSLVWACTNCDNCYEHCPQDVRPVEVIQALKNMVHKAGYSPPPVQPLVDSVAKMGRTTVVNDLIIKRRKELGLPELSEVPVDDLQTLLNGKDS